MKRGEVIPPPLSPGNAPIYPATSPHSPPLEDGWGHPHGRGVAETKPLLSHQSPMHCLHSSIGEPVAGIASRAHRNWGKTATAKVGVAW